MKVAIIGAGPTGLAMACELAKKGVAVHVYEKDETVGGLAKSVWRWNARIELGPHFLGENMNPQAKVFMQEIFDAVQMHHYERLTRIYLSGSFYNYPPDGVNIIKNMGVLECCKAFISLATKKRKGRKEPQDVASFVKQTFGRFIYHKFFKEYTEKLWGMPCKEIDAVFLKNLIGFKGNSILKKVRNMFTKKNAVTYKVSYYPEEGLSMLWEKMQQGIEANGGRFFFAAHIKKLVTAGSRITGIQLEDETVAQYDYVVATIPETILLRMLPPAPAAVTAAVGHIKFRSLILVFLLLEHCDIMQDNTVYLYSRQLRAARITNFNRFRNIPGNEVVMLEYWTSEGEGLWTLSDEKIAAIAREDLTVFSGNVTITVKDTEISRLKNAYEIPEVGFQKTKATVSAFIKGFSGLLTVGRASQINFNYGMGDAIADGYLKATDLLAKMENNK